MRFKIDSVNTLETKQKHVPRLNLIFHGLMAFREVGTQYYDVLIPFETPPGITNPCSETKPSGSKVAPHFAIYGNPIVDKELLCFPKNRSYFELKGVHDGTGTAARPSTTNTTILRSGSLVPQLDSIRTIVRIPKPDVIRHYRGAEVRGISPAQDQTSCQLVFAPPDLIHEVTVFSYFFFHDPKLIGGYPTLGNNHKWNVGDWEYPLKNENGAFNLCIYCQPIEECSDDDAVLLTNMFKIRSSGNNPKLSLFAPDLIADKPPSQTSIGIGHDQLLSLSELIQDKNYMEKLPKLMHERRLSGGATALADPGGCGSAFLCDGDPPPPPPPPPGG